MVNNEFFKAATHGETTDWERNEKGQPMVTYRSVGGSWSRVTEIKEANDMLSFDVAWSEQPGHVRNFLSRSEAVSMAKWLIR